MFLVVWHFVVKEKEREIYFILSYAIEYSGLNPWVWLSVLVRPVYHLT